MREKSYKGNMLRIYMVDQIDGVQTRGHTIDCVIHI